MNNDELRAKEFEIVESPAPPISVMDQTRLIADPELGRALERHPCWGPAMCRDGHLCPNCGARGQYLALLLHREKYGRARNPSEPSGRDLKPLLNDLRRLAEFYPDKIRELLASPVVDVLAAARKAGAA